MVGETSDESLTGLSSAAGTGTSRGYPFIAVASVAIPDTYYWAKVLSQKIGTSFFGVQFSNDGSILVTHSNEVYAYIIAFNTYTGMILSARSYFSNGH
jgi:hypothetical protein